MSRVVIPEARKSDTLSKALMIGGGVAGGMSGGPAGAMQGASAGSTAGSILSSNQGGQPVGAGAMQRRAKLLEPPPPGEYEQLLAAERAAAQSPQTQQYLPVLQKARMMAERGVA